jgi:hypothetical protein
MDLFDIPENERLTALRALKTVATANGAFGDPERAMLRAAAGVWRVDADADGLDPITPGDLAAGVAAPEARTHVLQACMLMSLADQNVTAEEYAALEAFRRALAVDEARMPVMQDLAKGRLFQARMHFRASSRAAIRSQLNDTGAASALRMMGLLPADRALVERCRALAALPDGTLGREYCRYRERNGFPWPGEKGGVVMGALHHDLTHVLTGYDTDPIGEIQIGSFTAGMKRVDPFVFLIFVMLEFHVGLAVRPFSEPTPGHYDAALAFRAHQAGTRCARDLTDQWDVWPEMARPVEDLRVELHIDV